MALASDEEKLTVPVYPVARFPLPSRASTVTEPDVPAMLGLGYPLTTRVRAAADETWMVPVTLRVPSDAVIVRLPVVRKVTEKSLLYPASAGVKEYGAGRTAWASLEEKETAPVYPVTRL